MNATQLQRPAAKSRFDAGSHIDLTDRAANEAADESDAICADEPPEAHADHQPREISALAPTPQQVLEKVQAARALTFRNVWDAYDALLTYALSAIEQTSARSKCFPQGQNDDRTQGLDNAMAMFKRRLSERQEVTDLEHAIATNRRG